MADTGVLLHEWAGLLFSRPVQPPPPPGRRGGRRGRAPEEGGGTVRQQGRRRGTTAGNAAEEGGAVQQLAMQRDAAAASRGSAGDAVSMSCFGVLMGLRSCVLVAVLAWAEKRGPGYTR
jgi:hypothetical protein